MLTITPRVSERKVYVLPHRDRSCRTIKPTKEGRKPEYPEKTPGDELQKTDTNTHLHQVSRRSHRLRIQRVLVIVLIVQLVLVLRGHVHVPSAVLAPGAARLGPPADRRTAPVAALDPGRGRLGGVSQEAHVLQQVHGVGQVVGQHGHGSGLHHRLGAFLVPGEMSVFDYRSLLRVDG